ncbi:MAG: O-antigen ligase family protein [Flavobacteriales bacterium]|nr:O-antigen ligase family protein [Flavobacteriales bacterium]
MNKIDYNYLEKILLRYLKIISLCFLIILIIDKFFVNHLVGRFTLTRNEIDYLDSISIAIVSSLLLILSSINLNKSIYNYLFFFIGWFLLLSTAARGAIIFTILTFLFLIFYRKKEIKLNYLYLFIVISLAALTNYIASLFFKNNFGGNNILLYRISHVTSEDSTVTRLKILKDALYQFVDQPFFGSHFLVVESKMYAHNIVLDALISTGIIGSILLLPIFFLFFKNLLNRSIPIFLVLLGIFYFLNTLTSGAIYNTGEFWMIFILIVNYNFNKIDNKLITNEL